MVIEDEHSSKQHNDKYHCQVLLNKQAIVSTIFARYEHQINQSLYTIIEEFLNETHTLAIITIVCTDFVSYVQAFCV